MRPEATQLPLSLRGSCSSLEDLPEKAVPEVAVPFHVTHAR